MSKNLLINIAVIIFILIFVVALGVVIIVLIVQYINDKKKKKDQLLKVGHNVKKLFELHKTSKSCSFLSSKT